MQTPSKYISLQQADDAGIVLITLEPRHALQVIDLYKTYRMKTHSKAKLETLFRTYPSIGFTQEGKLIAFCYTEFFAPDIIEIGSVFVLKSMRNHNLGSLLMAQIHDRVLSAGYNAAILSNSMLYKTHETKISADQFYQALGYDCVLQTADTRVFTRLLVARP